MNNSQNVSGNWNNVTNNQHQYFAGSYEVNIAKYASKSEKPITIANKPVKVFWSLLATIVAFAANILAIYTSLKDFPKVSVIPNFVIMLLPILLLTSFFLYSSLRKSKERGLKIGAGFFENHKSNLMYVTYRGTCPVCKGKLKFLQNYSNGKTFAQCKANTSQIFPFSPSQFDESNYSNH